MEDLFESIRRAVADGEDPGEMESRLWSAHGVECALLVLDSCGFSRTTVKMGIVHMLACFVEMRDLLLPVFRRNGCSEAHAHVDNLYARFETVDDALRSAFEATSLLRETGVVLADNEPLSVAIGIGYGWVLRSDSEGLFGEEMNSASRLGEDVGEAGDILLTEAAHRALRNPRGYSFDRSSVCASGVHLPYYRATRLR